MMKCIVRKFNKETDTGLIVSSYAKAVYFGAIIPFNENFRDFNRRFHKDIVFPQLESSKIMIACLENNPNVIIGYSIIEKDTLQFVFVKPGPYRNLGVATMLLKNQDFTEINEEHITKVGHAILRHKGELDASEERGSNAE